MITKSRLFGGAALLSVCLSATAGVEVTTPDGRSVLLNDDGTWEYIDQYDSDESAIPTAEGEDGEEPQSYAVLAVVRVRNIANGCLLGVALRNGMAFKIKSLVPSFSAYKDGDVLYQIVSKSFYEIKPTNSQYRQVHFIGVQCQDIAYIKVGGADRCTMGPYTKFSVEEGECLERIKVEESSLIEISK